MVTGRSTPATVSTAAYSSRSPHGRLAADCSLRRARIWPRQHQQMLVAEQTLKTQGPGAWPNTFVPASATDLTNAVVDPLADVTKSASNTVIDAVAEAAGPGAAPIADVAKAVTGAVVDGAADVAKAAAGSADAVTHPAPEAAPPEQSWGPA